MSKLYDLNWMVGILAAAVVILGISLLMLTYEIEKMDHRKELCALAIEKGEPLLCMDNGRVR